MLRSDWCRWKIQNHGHGRDQSADRAAPLGEPRWLPDPRGADRGPASASDPGGRPAPGCAGAVDPRPGAPARRFATGRGGRLCPARCRGVSEPAPRRPPPRLRRGGGREPGAGGVASRGAAPALRLPSQRARRLDVPAGGVAALAARGAGDDDRRRPRLRRPPRRRGAALRPGGLPRPRARRRRRSRAHHRHQRLHTGPRPGVPRARGGRREADRVGGPQQPRRRRSSPHAPACSRC